MDEETVTRLDKEAKKLWRKERLVKAYRETAVARREAAGWHLSYDKMKADLHTALHEATTRADQAEQDKRQVLVDIRQILAHERDRVGDAADMWDYYRTELRALYEAAHGEVLW